MAALEKTQTHGIQSGVTGTSRSWNPRNFCNISGYIEAEIKTAAIAEYKATGNKNPQDSVTVKIFKTFAIVDAKKVFDWAWKNLPAAFKIDEKKIEKYAKEFGEVDGTVSGDEPRAQIAANL